MWALMDRVHWEGMSVLDLGCGEGDMLLFTAQAGAAQVWGVDDDSLVTSRVLGRVSDIENIHLAYCGIMDWFRNTSKIFDISLCLSVLPYVSDFRETLHEIREHSHRAIIECQYAGDGPGPHWLENDTDMFRVLEKTGYTGITKLGSTEIPYRDMERSLWYCES